MNPFEGVRVVAAVVLTVLSCWGIIVARDGLFAYHISIRRPIMNRRRFLMTMFLSWGLALGLQGFISAITPDSRPLDFVSISVNVLYLYIILSMIVTIVVHFSGWMKYQDIIGNRSLIPESDVRVQEMVVEGRHVCHGIANELQGLIGGLEILKREGESLPNQIKLDIEEVYKQAIALGQSTAEVHQIVKDIGDVRNSSNYN
jgi:hypothetical protein